MTHYLVNIVREGRFYVARCPTLDVTSQGRSLEEAQANIREAIEAYIETFGKPRQSARRTGAAEPYWTTVAV